MTTLFLICGLGGGAILVVQLLLMVAGLGGDHDIGDGHDLSHDSSWFFGVLSFKALVAAVTFFGLGGLAASETGLGTGFSILTGLTGGAFAMVLVAWIMRLLMSLQSEGTARIENAIGRTAVVYLSVPGSQKGKGKVTVTVQDRTLEYTAVTEGETDLPTGSMVEIVGVAGPDTLLVESSNDRDLAYL
ncbi:MAG: hypothetical protein AMXMBFR84_06500 [Candidatus Hydrogenedentota bacterium]